MRIIDLDFIVGCSVVLVRVSFNRNLFYFYFFKISFFWVYFGLLVFLVLSLGISGGFMAFVCFVFKLIYDFDFVGVFGFFNLFV